MQIPATATALRYKPERMAEEDQCELLGGDSASVKDMQTGKRCLGVSPHIQSCLMYIMHTVVATKSGVELFYASSVNSSDCAEGSSFQVSDEVLAVASCWCTISYVI